MLRIHALNFLSNGYTYVERLDVMDWKAKLHLFISAGVFILRPFKNEHNTTGVVTPKKGKASCASNKPPEVPTVHKVINKCT